MKRFGTLALCAALAGASAAYTYLDTPAPKWGGPPVGSGSGGTVTFFMNAAGTDDVAGGPATGDGEVTMLTSDLGKWKTATGGSLDLAYGGSTPMGAVPMDGVNVVAWGSLGPGIGAVTSPVYFDGLMEEADVEMNSDMDWSDAVLFENVLLHELGHAVGMDHEDGVPAVMASAAMGTTDLTTDDIAGISALYGTGTGGGAPPPPPGGTGESPPSDSGSSGGGGGGDGHKGNKCGLTGLEFPIVFGVVVWLKRRCGRHSCKCC
ncbi:MAG: peptidase M10A and M12B matrixin and [Planctomycetota bacterium]|nr:MAG: peptidase M10A and M12B matrixin and [Planctomycetota bacterium]